MKRKAQGFGYGVILVIRRNTSVMKNERLNKYLASCGICSRREADRLIDQGRVTEKDRFAEKKITDMVKFPIRVTYAGRLDKDSEGLILLTNDGKLISRMMQGSAGHEKEYVVKVNKEITDVFLKTLENPKDDKGTGVPCLCNKKSAGGEYTSCRFKARAVSSDFWK